MTDKTFPGKARTVALPSGPPPPPAPMPPRPGERYAPAEDDRGLAALAERLHEACCGPKTQHEPGTGWMCHTALVERVLGPSGRFSPDGGLDVERLARALPTLSWDNPDWHVLADELAREYARLATPKEEQG